MPSASGAVKRPQSTSIPTAVASAAASAGTVTSGGEGALVYVEIGAGDLKASIELTKKGRFKLIEVDPVAPAAAAIKVLEAAGGTFIKGTAESSLPGTSDHVFQYFPRRIGGLGRMVTRGTWRLLDDTIRLLKPSGAAYYLTEDVETAKLLAKEARTSWLKAVIAETAAGAAAPLALGAGVPKCSSTLKVWLVNIYK